MADVLHFDIDQALDQFLKIFWTKGFRATTTRELAKSAGISESSLFHTFSSKRAIYISTLRRYRKNSRFLLTQMENEENALTGIRNYWLAIGKFVSNSSFNRGCMITNATVEQPDGEEIQSFLQSVHQEYDKEFKRALDRAVTQGELKADTDTKALAQYLANSLQGLRVLARISPEKKKVQNIIKYTMQTVDQFRT